MFFKVFTTIAGVTVAFFVLAAQITDPGGGSNGITIPLTKHSDTTDARESHDAASHNAKIIDRPGGMPVDGSERNTGTLHPSAVQRDVFGAGLKLIRFMDGIWYGYISIGTPPRWYTVQINTASSDLFIAAATGDETCRSHFGLLNPAESFTNSDLNMDFMVTFEDGRTARGKQYTDTVTIAGFTAKRQAFGAATKYSPNMAETQFAPDGVLGLAFPSLSESHGQSPLLYTLFNQGHIYFPVFSLKLTSSGGELYIGGMNGAYYLENTLVYTPVTYPALWELEIDSIRVNDMIILRHVPAIIDTGANFIYGNPQQVLDVHKAADGGRFSNGRGYFTFPCKSVPIVTFTIGGRDFSLSADVINKGQAGYSSPNCWSGIAVVNEDHEYWTIGTIFLQQFYTVFDFNSQSPRVGFAELRGGAS